MSEIKELPPVAQKMFVICKKCAVDRYHTVLTHVSATSAKIQCEVCKAKRTFKLDENKPKVAKPRRVSKSTAPMKSNALQWQELKDKIGATQPKPYNMKERFLNQTAVNHPKFGLGFVTGTTSQSIQVIFEDCPRALIHNRQS